MRPLECDARVSPIACVDDVQRTLESRSSTGTHVVTALLALGLISCSPVAPERFRFTQLPQSLELGVASFSLQTTSGDVYVSTFMGKWLRLKKGATTWEVVTEPGLTSVVADFQQGKALGLSTTMGGYAIETTTGFALLDPPVNVPPGTPLGRDKDGTLWAMNASATHVLLSKWDPGARVWTTENLTYPVLPAGTPTGFTSTGRLFLRPHDKGLFEADRDTKTVVERVPCTHPMFRPSHPDSRACQEDTTLLGDLDGSLLIATPNREVWRLPARATEPVLVVKSELSGITRPDPEGLSFIGIPQVHLDAKRRLWLVYRWGLNTSTDVVHLHVADATAAQPVTWVKLRDDLERNMRAYGVGPTPVLSTGSLDQGLNVIRIDE